MNDESQDSKNELLAGDEPETTMTEPLPWEHGVGAQLVLDAMNIESDDDNLVVSCKVERFTVETKASDGNYGSARGYAELVPQNLWLHLNVRKPASLVDENGNVGLLEAVYRQVALALDRSVFKVASGRVDVQVAKKDAEAATKARRYDAGKGVVAAQKTGESL